MLTEVREIIPFLEKSLNGKIIDCNTAPLTAQGHHYGSTMLSMKVTVIPTDSNHTTNGDSKTIPLAVKLPVTNTVLTSIFQPSVTCVKENSFYTEIIPAFNQLQQECGVQDDDLLEMFITCYGARLSNDENAKVADQNAVLVLENIKYKGFKCGGRPNGFDKHDTEIILKNLAKFHALPIALRILRPKTFEAKVMPHMRGTNSFEIIDTDYAMTKSFCKTIQRLHDIDEHLIEKVSEALKSCADWRTNRNLEASTPFTTISHRDLWTNNIMYSCDEYDRMEKVKFIDYQLMAYDSFVNDVIFVLYTSVNIDIRKQNIEHFFQLYYDHFYQTLKQFGCPLDDYTYENYRKEIEDKAKNELEHIIYMLKVILGEKVSDGGDLKFDTFLSDDYLGQKFYDALKSLLIEFKDLNLI